MLVAMPRSSASGWRWRVSENRRIRASSLASRKMITGRIPRPSSAPRIAPKASGTSPVRTSSTIAVAGEAQRILRHEVREIAEQLAGQVVDHDVAEVLEQLRGRGLAAAGQAREDHHLLGRKTVAGHRAEVVGVRQRAPVAAHAASTGPATCPSAG